MWPPGTNVKRLMKEMKKPSDNWMKFELVKIKFKSNKRKECEDYDFTTTAELSPDEADSDHGKKKGYLRKKCSKTLLQKLVMKKAQKLLINQLEHLKMEKIRIRVKVKLLFQETKKNLHQCRSLPQS
ncbi:uncharacterized protein LOC127721509 [Mytilus californianus]|uniref:uncharacterized protein LOC127721509 n=1 Tax=Mytilus californianus TaxID=6549 RepID=UPI0022481436|nr:uncharacterized protein LOC127721509 [Mytilus californianus]